MKEILKGLGVGCLLLTAGMTTWAYDEQECEYGMKKNSRMEKMDKKKEMRRPPRIEKLTKDLNLSEEQQKQISEILKEGRVKIEAERKTFREKIQEIRKAGDGQIEKVLNGEQLKKWTERKKKIGEKAKERKGKREEGQKRRFKKDVE
ncbi:MAG: hypothetical protein ABIH68_06365 [bacterium]